MRQDLTLSCDDVFYDSGLGPELLLEGLIGHLLLKQRWLIIMLFKHRWLILAMFRLSGLKRGHVSSLKRVEHVQRKTASLYMVLRGPKKGKKVQFANTGNSNLQPTLKTKVETHFSFYHPQRFRFPSTSS